MTDEHIDIRLPMEDICFRLGIAYHLTAHIDFRPDIVTADVYVANEHGKPHIDLATGEAVMETLQFKVRA